MCEILIDYFVPLNEKKVIQQILPAKLLIHMKEIRFEEILSHM